MSNLLVAWGKRGICNVRNEKIEKSEICRAAPPGGKETDPWGGGPQIASSWGSIKSVVPASIGIVTGYFGLVEFILNSMFILVIN